MAGLTSVMNYLVLQLDDVIIGQTINSQAVGAVGLVSPFVTLTLFASTFVADGTISCILCEIGKLHKHRASVYFTNGLFLSLLAGLLCVLIGAAAKDVFIGSVRSNALIYAYASDYFRIILVAAFLMPLFTFLQQIVYIAGKERLYILSYGASIAGNVFFSVVLSHRFGVAGIAWGTAIGYLLGGLFLLPYFLFGRRILQLNYKTSRNKLKSIAANGLAAASPLVCSFFFTFFLNRYFLAHFSVFRLPILAVVLNIIEMSAVFGGFGKASAPFLALYRGENNAPNLNAVKTFSVIPGFIFSLVVTFATVLFAPGITMLFGIPGAMLELSVQAIYLTAISLFPTVYLMILTDYHCTIGSLSYAGLISFIRSLAVPMLLTVLLSGYMGMTGIWLGLGTAPYVAALLLCLPLRIRGLCFTDLFTMKNTPDPSVYSFELAITQENITALQKKLDGLLSEHGISRRTRNDLTLLVEEVFMLTLENNPGRELSGECTVSIRDELLLVTKDNGVLFDVTDCDMPITSFRSFMISCLMESHVSRLNITTLCCNRNAFRLPIERDAPQQELSVLS